MLMLSCKAACVACSFLMRFRLPAPMFPPQKPPQNRNRCTAKQASPSHAVLQLALGAHQETICMELDSKGPQPDHMAQGYAHPRDHSGHGHACRAHATRMLGSAMIPPGVMVGSLRVSAPGWEGWVIDGFRVRLLGCASWNRFIA